MTPESGPFHFDLRSRRIVIRANSGGPSNILATDTVSFSLCCVSKGHTHRYLRRFGDESLSGCDFEYRDGQVSADTGNSSARIERPKADVRDARLPVLLPT
jgi:hypothetical protein